MIPAGIEVMKIAAIQGRFQLRVHRLPVGIRLLSPHRAHGRPGRDRADAQVRRDLPRRDRRPALADHITAREIICPFRQQLREYVDLRPMRLLPGIDSPLRGRTSADIDGLRPREFGGRDCGIGGRLHRGTPDELAEQTGIFTRLGIERIARYAFTLAQTRPRRLLASATKSNALQHSMVLWDEVVADVAKDFPDVTIASITWTRLRPAWSHIPPWT